MNTVRADAQLQWTPGRDWLAAVLALHALIVGPWLAAIGAWALVPCAASALYHIGVFLRGEIWRIALIDETLVVFEPAQPGRAPRAATLRGAPWLTANWVVLRTGRRVLMLHARHYDAQRFARLRRALLGAGAAAG